MAKWVRQHYGPRSSGPHRVACKALYRALLELCPRVPLPDDLPSQGAVNPIKHLIRKGFRRRQYNASPRLAVKALTVGYNAEELLRAAASGSQAATSQIHNLLYRLHAQRQQSKQPRPPPRPEPPRLSPYPGAPKVLDIRPLPREQLSGKRGVPILTHASGVPFLRFKKPQSPFLSRVLRNKLEQKHKLFEGLKRIDETHSRLATWEDSWDQHVAQQMEREGGNRSQIRDILEESEDFRGWRNENAAAREAVWSRVMNWTSSMKATAARMREIVEEEQKLRDEEVKIEKREKRERRAKRREEREKQQEEKEAPVMETHIPSRDL